MMHTKRNCTLLYTFILIAASYFFCFMLSPMVFHTDDDALIDLTLAKAQPHTIWWAAMFISPILSKAIGQFYIVKNISWWYVFQQILIVGGVFSTNYSFMETSREKKVPLYYSLLLIFAFDVVLLCPWIAYVSFTTTPSISIGGLIAIVLLNRGKKVKKQGNCFWATVIIVGYIIAFMLRDASGGAALPYLLLSILIKYTHLESISQKRYGKMVLRFIFVVLFFVICSLGLFIINKVLVDNIQGSDFVQFNEARVQYCDYGHDSFSDNPAIYDKVNWDANMANLGWNFMMKEKTTDSLRYITSHSSKDSRKARILKCIRTVFDDNNCLNTFLFAAVLCVGAFVIIILNKNKVHFLFWLFNNLGTLLITCFVMIQGRWLYRAEYAILYPMCVINFFFVLCGIQKRKNIAIVCASIFLCLSYLGYREYMLLEETRDNKISKEERNIAWVDYLNEHPENIYVEEISSSVRYMSPKGRVFFDNHTSTGGSDWNSAARQEFARVHGFDKGLSPDIFKEDNVYYVGTFSEDLYSSTMDYLLYMMNHYDAIGVAIVDRPNIVGDICVMHFVYPSNICNYESYYTFVDGQLIIIDID